MVKLSGILGYSMGGFLCLRGFASYKMLCGISEPSPQVQRDLIESHKEELARFLEDGEYRFFPEIVLSLSLTDGTHDLDLVQQFHDILHSGGTWNRRLGKYEFHISQNTTKNQAGRYSPASGIDRINLAHITFDESECKLTRIDGNHRLSAADGVEGDFLTPYCLILFRYPKENDQYSRAIFHNINAKQRPLKLEENLRVILDSPETFSDDKLKTDNSFGWKYYLARKVFQKLDLRNYPFIYSLIRGVECTYLLEEFGELLHCGRLEEAEESAELFLAELPDIESALREAQLRSVPENIAVAGAVSYYKLTDPQKYVQFIYWIKKNCIAEAPNIHMGDLICIFDKFYESMPKKVFLSMQFSDDMRDTAQTVKDVCDIIRRDNGISIDVIKVDEHTDGYSGDIYQRIVEGIKGSALVIADLTNGNRNVHHEIGYAQGFGKNILLLYRTRDGVDAKKEIGSNISMYDQIRYRDQTELRKKLLVKLQQFFDIL